MLSLGILIGVAFESINEVRHLSESVPESIQVYGQPQPGSMGRQLCTHWLENTILFEDQQDTSNSTPTSIYAEAESMRLAGILNDRLPRFAIDFKFCTSGLFTNVKARGPLYTHELGDAFAIFQAVFSLISKS
jgi:hypothetical protein